MPNVSIVTDSCASIPEALLKSLNIQFVPYYIHRGKEVLRDLVTVLPKEFYKWLATATEMPKTANPGPGDYAEMYDQLVEEQGAREIISIHMTSKSSGAYQSALAGREIFLEKYPKIKIEVIDTLNVAMAQGWVVIEAAREALAGKSLGSIVASVKKLIPKVKMIQTADTLKYLYMGGRIGKAKHLMGSVLNIKPLIGMEEGVIVALGTARSRCKAYQRMAEMDEAAAGSLGKVKVAYTHVAALEEVDKLREMVESRLTVVESLVSELSPALGVHSGPGTAGLCYYPLED
jgi:DegV family protein with EDD domain